MAFGLFRSLTHQERSPYVSLTVSNQGHCRYFTWLIFHITDLAGLSYVTLAVQNHSLWSNQVISGCFLWGFIRTNKTQKKKHNQTSTFINRLSSSLVFQYQMLTQSVFCWHPIQKVLPQTFSLKTTREREVMWPGGWWIESLEQRETAGDGGWMKKYPSLFSATTNKSPKAGCPAEPLGRQTNNRRRSSFGSGMTVWTRTGYLWNQLCKSSVLCQN